jgi:hypothetical protein
MFNSLHALPAYNDILITTVNWLIARKMERRVFFIPGSLNTIADALSHFQNDVAMWHVPGLTIWPFTPPRFTLGEVTLCRVLIPSSLPCDCETLGIPGVCY